MSVTRSLGAMTLALALAPAAAGAQSMPMPMSSSMPMPMVSATAAPVPVVPNPPHRGWPQPVEDNPRFSYLLLDQLEYRTAGSGTNGARFDAMGWTGGDVKRLWYKTEGFASSASPRDREAEASLLYGRLIKPFYDAQAGVRFVPGLGTKPSRTYAVVGLQGLAPYNFDVEPSLFISQSGRLSARFTGSYDVPLSQRLFLQPRIETNLALQKDQAVGIGTGINDVDLALRLRYEIRREFAPYVGIGWLQKFGQTHAFALREGPDRAQFPIVGGLRIWF